jgi:hypothetical protein
MLKALRVAVCLCALAGTAVCSASPPVQAPAQADRPAPNRLTAARPEVRLSLPARPTSNSVLVLRVAEIKNPARAPISLDAALAPCPGSAKTWEPERLASLGVYPSDQAGSYSLPVTAPLGRLRARGVTDMKDTCLQVSIRLIKGREPVDSVEVTLAAAEWREEK